MIAYLKNLANQKHPKCKKRRKYFLVTILFVVIVLSTNAPELSLLVIKEFICSHYKCIRNFANGSEDVKFFSSSFTIIGFSLAYLVKRLIKKSNTLEGEKKELEGEKKELEGINKALEDLNKRLSDLSGGNEENVKKEIDLRNKEIELRKLLKEKNRELIREREDDPHLLDQINDIKIEIKVIQDKLKNTSDDLI